MSISFTVFLVLLLTHLVADFFVQTERQANTKYQDDQALLEHVTTYVICFIPFSFFYFQPLAAIVFLLLTMYLHALTDRQTSKLTHYYFVEKKDNRKGFQIIGIDQTIHMICVYGLVELLSTNILNIR